MQRTCKVKKNNQSNKQTKNSILTLKQKENLPKNAFGLVLCESWALGLPFRVFFFPSETPLEKSNLLFSIGCQLEIVFGLNMDMYVQCSRTPIWLRSLWSMSMWPPFLWFHMWTSPAEKALMSWYFQSPPDSYTLSVFSFVYSLSLERRALMRHDIWG